MNLITTQPNPSSSHRSLKKLTRRALPLLAFSAAALVLVACNEQTPPLVDTKPLGDGLRVIAYSVVAVGVLSVLGKLVK